MNGRDFPRWVAALASAAVLGAVAALYLATAPGPGLIEPDEARYGEMARDMVVSGEWLTPRVNFVEYFQKPPLVAWAMATAFTLLGVGELGARLPSLIAALVSIALTGVLAARIYGLALAPLAMLILAAAPLFAVMAVHAGLDMTLSGFITAALAAAWWGIETGARRWWRLTALAVALAVLAKGFVAPLIVAGVVVPHVLWHQGWPGLRRALDPIAIAIGLAVLLPWFVLMEWSHPGFLHYFVVEQHFGRYVANVDHPLPFWFLPVIVPLLPFPWGIWPLLEPSVWRSAAPRQWSEGTRYLLLWTVFVIAFYSFASSKLPNYVLPALPPLAILLARLAVVAVAGGGGIGVRRLAVGLLVAGLLTGAAGAIVPLVDDHWRAQAMAPYLYAGGLMLAVTGAATCWTFDRGRPWAALAALAIGSLAATAVVLGGRSIATSYRDLGLAARAALRPGDRVAVFRRNVHGLTFYGGERTLMIGGPGELRFGFDYGEHQAWFRPEHEIWDLWSAPGRMLLVLTQRELDALDPPLDPPPILLAAEHKKLLIANRP